MCTCSPFVFLCFFRIYTTGQKFQIENCSFKLYKYVTILLLSTVLIYGDFFQQHKILIITSYWPLVLIKIQQLIVLNIYIYIYIYMNQAIKKSKNIFSTQELDRDTWSRLDNWVSDELHFFFWWRWVQRYPRSEALVLRKGCIWLNLAEQASLAAESP